MSVLLLIAKTSLGAQVADPLSGGGVGYDIGVTRNGGYSGLISKAANTGHNDFYLSHDAINDPVSNFSLFVEPYTQLYGGVRSAAVDYAKLQSLAEATDGSKNNGTGGAGGFAIDMDWDVIAANQFDYINFGPIADSIVTGGGGGVVRYFRRTDSGNIVDEGSDLITRINILSQAAFYETGAGPVSATTPLDGFIGKSDDTILGNRMRVKARLFLPQLEIEGGETQWDLTTAFTYTS